ncbi:MAG: pirin family protein [Gammaproteobacteria bacterium]
MAAPQPRPIAQLIPGMPATDGAGVKLKRIIGSPALDQLDPFLLFDEFRSDNPDDYIEGFPDHPHRGFETVTYLLHGRLRHRDSKGNEGLLRPGSVQWMTAGRGIIHSEMPETEQGLLWGYQLWVNLPARLKMTEPNYQDIPAEAIPEVTENGCKVRVIAGEHGGVKGAAKTFINVLYLDLQLAKQSLFERPLPASMNAFAYAYGGAARVHAEGGAKALPAGQVAVFGAGDAVRIEGGENGAKLLLIAAERLNEPVARYGPFVMNTAEQIHQAFRDYQSGRLAG